MAIKKKLLWISMRAPYDLVRHAGGKTHNFYLKSFAKNELFDITLLTSCSDLERDIVKKECESCNVCPILMVNSTKGISKFMRKIVNIESLMNPYNRNACLTTNSLEISVKYHLNILKKYKYQPDVIFLEWTQINLLAPYIKKLFEKSYIIEIEEDVAFLGYQRQLKLHNTRYWDIKYNSLKNKELKALSIADLIVVNNIKDFKLLRDNKIYNNIFTWSPFYQKFELKRNFYKNKMKIIIYGAMYRPENYKSAIWFIENVEPLIANLDYELLIVGSNPPEELKKYESDHIHIKGFVDDLNELFSAATCMVAPLVLGAGIKVKVLEAFSAGIPVITNSIGIEGIPAENNKEYMHAESPLEYCEWLNRISNGSINLEKMSKMEIEFVNRKFNFEMDSEKLQEIIINMCEFVN